MERDWQLSVGVEEVDTLESTVLGRARLLSSHVQAPERRLSGSFALPILGHPCIIFSEADVEPVDRVSPPSACALASVASVLAKNFSMAG